MGEESPPLLMRGEQGEIGLILLEWTTDPSAVDCPLPCSLLASCNNLSTDFNPLAIASFRLVLICPSRMDGSVGGGSVSFVTSTQDPGNSVWKNRGRERETEEKGERRGKKS